MTETGPERAPARRRWWSRDTKLFVGLLAGGILVDMFMGGRSSRTFEAWQAVMGGYFVGLLAGAMVSWVPSLRGLKDTFWFCVAGSVVGLIAWFAW